jgi:hypothetical protein
MRRDTPSISAEEDATLVMTAPLRGIQPRRSSPPTLNLHEKEAKEPSYLENDISSLALGFVPFPFTAGYTMDSPAARRFSTSAEERVGLLSAAKTHYGAVADEVVLEGQLEEAQTTMGIEARLLAKNSIPLMITYLLQYSFSLVTLFVVGHIGTDELGAVSLATMTANITGLAVYEGLATSLDTLCAQAYGSGKKELVGLHLQRMVLFMLLISIPIGAVWLSSGWILAALVPEKELAHLAGRYLSILLAGAPGYAIFEAGKRFTQAQGLFNASLFVLLIATPINVLLNYLFVFVLKWDLEGAALATVLSHNLLPVLLFIYVYFINPSSLVCWAGFTRDAFRHWGPMAKLAVPGIIMVETEWLVSHARPAATVHSIYLQRTVGLRYPNLQHQLPVHRTPRSPIYRYEPCRRNLPRSIQRRRRRQHAPRESDRRRVAIIRAHRDTHIRAHLPHHRRHRLHLSDRVPQRAAQSFQHRPGSHFHRVHGTAAARGVPVLRLDDSAGKCDFARLRTAGDWWVGEFVCVLRYCGAACAIFVLQEGSETRGIVGWMCGRQQLYYRVGGSVHVLV